MKNILIVCLLVAGFAVGLGFVLLSKPAPVPAPALSATAGWKTYTDPLGFSLKYPPDVLLNDDSKNSAQMRLYISSDKLSDIPEDLPMNMGRASAVALRDNLAKGVGDTVKIGTYNGGLSYSLSQFEECSVLFSRSLTFFPGDYRVQIMLVGPVGAIKASMPGYFAAKSPCPETAWNQNKISTFIPTLAAHKGSGAAQAWYDTFDNIVTSITFTP